MEGGYRQVGGCGGGDDMCVKSDMWRGWWTGGVR